MNDQHEEPQAEQGVEIPFAELSESTLRGVIEEFVLREGTEYGAADYSLETKVVQVRKQLERGDVVIVWNAQTETCSIVTKVKARRFVGNTG